MKSTTFGAVLLMFCGGVVSGQPTVETCRPPSDERLIFYTTDILGEFFPYTKTNGVLKMMRGEYKLAGRKTNFSLPENDAAPSYLITEWVHQTDKPSNNVTRTTIGYTNGHHITGPAVDHKNKAVYYISRGCVLNDTGGVDVTTPSSTAVKLGGTEQQTPHGGTGDTSVTCTSNLFGLQRYNWASNTWDLLHQGTTASFPGNDQYNQEHWQVAFDPNTNKLWYNVYDNALTNVQITGSDYFVSSKMYSLDTSMAAGAMMQDAVLAYTITTTEQGAYHQLIFDCESNLFVQDYGKVHRLDVSAAPTTVTHTYPVPKTFIRTTLCAGSVSCVIGGMGIDPVNKIVYYAVYIASENVYQIRRVGYTTSTGGSSMVDNCMYTRMLYEFSTVGQTIMNMDVDVVNQQLYLVSYGSNAKGRGLQRVDILAEGTNSTACFWGYQTDCKFRQSGEELVIGYAPAADSAFKVGSGHASNFANGEVLSYDSGNTIFGVVGPKELEPRGRCNYTWQKNTPKASERVVNYQCDPMTQSQDFTRRIFFQLDPGLASDRTSWLMEQRGWNQQTLVGSATYSGGVYKQRFYFHESASPGDAKYNTMHFLHNAGLDYSNASVPPGTTARKRRGVTIAGPTFSKKQRMLYWMSCETGFFTETCMEYGIWRVNVDTMEEELVVQHPKQLMPAPNQYTWSKAVLAIDDQRNVLYLLIVPYNGYASPTDSTANAEMLYSFDMQDQTFPLVECSAQLEVEFTELDGSIRGMHVDTCDGSVWILETSSIWRWRVGETKLTEFLNIRVAINDTSSSNLTASSSRYFGGLALDDESGYLYLSYVKGFSGSSAWRGIIRVKKDTTGMEWLYWNVNYEMSYLNARPQYLRQLTLDLVNKQIYVMSYYGNSYERSVLMLPMPGNANFTGLGSFACLYGHHSISHSRDPDGDGPLTNGNRDCTYQGPEAGQGTLPFTGFDVAIPKGAVYILTQAAALVVLPGPKGQYENPAAPACGVIGSSDTCGGTQAPTSSPSSFAQASSAQGGSNTQVGGTPGTPGGNSAASGGASSPQTGASTTAAASTAAAASGSNIFSTGDPSIPGDPFPTGGTAVSGVTTSFSSGTCCADNQCNTHVASQKSTLISNRQFRNYYIISDILSGATTDATQLEIHVKGGDGTSVRTLVLTYAEYQKLSSGSYAYYADLSDLTWSSCSAKGVEFKDAAAATDAYENLRLVVDYDDASGNGGYTLSVSTGAGPVSCLLALLVGMSLCVLIF